MSEQSQCQVSLSVYMCQTAFTGFADSRLCISRTWREAAPKVEKLLIIHDFYTRLCSIYQKWRLEFNGFSRGENHHLQLKKRKQRFLLKQIIFEQDVSMKEKKKKKMKERNSAGSCPMLKCRSAKQKRKSAQLGRPSKKLSAKLVDEILWGNCFVQWDLCALHHGIHISMEAILACHPARSTEWLDCHPKWCELWHIRTGPINVPYIYFLKMCLSGLRIYGECTKSYERESKKYHLKVLSIFPFGMVEWPQCRRNRCRFLPLACKSRIKRFLVFGKQTYTKAAAIVFKTFQVVP